MENQIISQNEPNPFAVNKPPGCSRSSGKTWYRKALSEKRGRGIR